MWFEKEYMKFYISIYRTNKATKKVPPKVLRYIPIIPCLQQLFRCKRITWFMDYHAHNRSEDDIMWMPIDGYEFRDIEEKWPHFKEEPCNVGISLETYGVNLFENMRYINFVWPLFVINNNIPPLMEIKREHIMLAMIIPGMCLQFFFNRVASHLPYFVA